MQLYWKYLHACIDVDCIVGIQSYQCGPAGECGPHHAVHTLFSTNATWLTWSYCICTPIQQISVIVKVGLSKVWNFSTMFWNVKCLNTSSHIRTSMKKTWQNLELILEQAVCTTFQNFLIPGAQTHWSQYQISIEVQYSLLWSHNVQEPVMRADFVSKWFVLKFRDNAKRSQVFSFL